MEEILSSIRRIISEDDKESAQSPAPAEAAPLPANGFGAGDASVIAPEAEAPTIGPDALEVPDAPEAPAPSILAQSTAPENPFPENPFPENPFNGEAGPAAMPAAEFQDPVTSIAAPPIAPPAAPPAAPSAVFASSVPADAEEPLTLSEPLTEPLNGHGINGFGAAPDAAEGEEVLDLTEMVASDGRVVKITPQGPSEAAYAEDTLSQNGFDQGYDDNQAQLTNGSTTFGASFGQAAQVEVGSADEVSYAEADLNGTPAYMAADNSAADYSPADPAAVNEEEPIQEVANGFAPAAPAADAFAELAGAEEQGSDETMTQNPTDNGAGGQPAFGANAFPAADPTADLGGGAGLDAMVQKMAEPMIRQWIEQNMPQMIEAIVRDEVARRLSGG
jgi:cell pole-organizing protein PopZ